MRVCIFAVILKDIWDHRQNGNNATETRPCTESYTILVANDPLPVHHIARK